MFTVTKNKAQFIDLICEDLVNHKDEMQQHRLVVTGSLPTPVELHKGVSIMRHDMRTNQEEADTILVQQVAFVQSNESLVVADDTDVFVMLLHFSYHKQIPGNVYMVSPAHGRAVLDIKESVKKHYDIVPDLLSSDGLTGCDTVGAYHGHGKGGSSKSFKDWTISIESSWGH